MDRTATLKRCLGALALLALGACAPSSLGGATRGIDLEVAKDEVALRVSGQRIQRGTWQLIEPNSALQTHDRFRIELFAGEPLYLYVLRAAQGEVSHLYPPADAASTAPRSSLRLPEDSDFYTLQPPAGLEDLRAVASRRPLSGAEVLDLAAPSDTIGKRFPPPTIPERKRDPYSVRTRLNEQGTAALRFTFVQH